MLTPIRIRGARILCKDGLYLSARRGLVSCLTQLGSGEMSPVSRGDRTFRRFAGLLCRTGRVVTKLCRRSRRRGNKSGI